MTEHHCPAVPPKVSIVVFHLDTQNVIGVPIIEIFPVEIPCQTKLHSHYLIQIQFTIGLYL